MWVQKIKSNNSSGKLHIEGGIQNKAYWTGCRQRNDNINDQLLNTFSMCEALNILHA